MPYQNTAICVCWGGGWDSTAMLIEMARRGIMPDLITMADVGGEKQGTYDFIPVFSQWLVDHGMPRPQICEYQPKPETTARYRAAVERVADRLDVTLSEIELSRLSRLYGNMLANETLPGIAMGVKSCSMKWKIDAQEPLRRRLPENVQAWAEGRQVIKAIGFDATEDYRTYGGSTRDNKEYKFWYPLRDWDLDRQACGAIITEAGLPLPPKSACFFCPAMKAIEVMQLKTSDPDKYRLALAMEDRFRTGKHFRGDNVWTIRATHKQTGEQYTEDYVANDAADARAQFRRDYDDTARPFNYKLSASAAVVGLSRRETWADIAC